MRLCIVVAASTNNVIGANGTLPWHLSDDLKRFRKLTTGKPIIMGRLTHESIGRPLPDRRNIVLSTSPDYAATGCEVVASADEALELVADAADVMVIGGAHIYAGFLPLCDRIYLTRVHATVEGDTFLPELSESDWSLIESEDHKADERHDYAFSFQTLDRREKG